MLRLFEIASMLVRFNHVARVIVNANHSIMLPYDWLWYGELDAISDAIGYGLCAIAPLVWGFRVPAIPSWPRLRHAQAREEEAETL
jgi:hypothetical protein